VLTSPVDAPSVPLVFELLDYLPRRYAPGGRDGRPDLTLAVDRAAVTITFGAGVPAAEIGRARFADDLAAARDQLAAAREQFREHPAFVEWARLAAVLSDLRAREREAAARPAECLREARELIADGKDPSEPESRYAASLADRDIVRNRLGVVEEQLAAARPPAEAALTQALEEARLGLWEQAVAEKARLVDELTAFVESRLEALHSALRVVAHLAVDSDSCRAIRGRKGATIVGEFFTLPDPEVHHEATN
jgi:hypothetical protein